MEIPTYCAFKALPLSPSMELNLKVRKLPAYDTSITSSVIFPPEYLEVSST